MDLCIPEPKEEFVLLLAKFNISSPPIPMQRLKLSPYVKWMTLSPKDLTGWGSWLDQRTKVDLRLKSRCGGDLQR
jgi:hypothetical protein